MWQIALFLWSILSSLKYFRLVLYGIPVLLALWFFWPSSQSDIVKLANENAKLRNDVRLRDARILSNLRMIQRRDNAIEASACKDQIKYWVSNPDKVPKKFDPFKTGPLGQ